MLVSEQQALKYFLWFLDLYARKAMQGKVITSIYEVLRPCSLNSARVRHAYKRLKRPRNMVLDVRSSLLDAGRCRTPTTLRDEKSEPSGSNFAHRIRSSV
jgi:hypothetical protein